MRKLIVGAIASLAVVVALVLTPSVAYATDYSVNMHQACQIQHGAGWQAELTHPEQGAYGWRCWVPPWGVRKSVSVQGYCNYFGLGTAVVLDPNNAYSWRCRT